MWRWLRLWRRRMIVEGVCDHCGHVLFPEMRENATPTDFWFCPHCDRGHTRANCGKCDVMFRSGDTADLEDGL